MVFQGDHMRQGKVRCVCVDREPGVENCNQNLISDWISRIRHLEELLLCNEFFLCVKKNSKIDNFSTFSCVDFNNDKVAILRE